jgi:hypothetical protein
MAISSLFTKILPQSSINKAIQVCNDLGINPNWLLAVIYFETARTMSPQKTNSIGSVGLIQFTRDKAGVNYKTINGKKFYLSEIAKMDFIKQMDLVHLYYLPYKGKIKSFLDCYLVTFFPSALGKSDSYILQTSGLSQGIIAKQNPIFDLNKNGSITLGEIKTRFSAYYGKKEFSIIQAKDYLPLLLLIPFFFPSLF